MRTWEVESDQDRYGWSVITPDGRTLPLYGDRLDAVKFACSEAKACTDLDRIDTAVNVHDADGFIVQAILYFPRGA